MPFTDEALRAQIHEWIKRDGSKLGRITSTTPLALNMNLVEVAWKGAQQMVKKSTITYVCNTTLEAELRVPFFPCRLMVICEQEPGTNMGGVVARGQFALLARKVLVRRPAYNVKLLGVS